VVYVRAMRALILCVALVAGCGAKRTTFAQYPGAPAAFERDKSQPQAVAIADQVIAACGGHVAWDRAKQIRWSMTSSEGDPKQGELAWDRWNGRHWTRIPAEEGAAVAVYETYGDYALAYMEKPNGTKKVVDGPEKGIAIEALKVVFQLQVTAMFLPYLMEEPGAKLEYVGPVKDGEVELDELKVTFDDPAHRDLVFRAKVDKTTHLIKRVDIEKPSTMERIGFELADWQDAGGLKIAGTMKNIGSGGTIAIKDIQVGSPDDSLYTAPLN
jgi:hypothetical protein